jgi:hypothetical protein
MSAQYSRYVAATDPMKLGNLKRTLFGDEIDLEAPWRAAGVRRWWRWR